jgi:hypothetical protein
MMVKLTKDAPKPKRIYTKPKAVPATPLYAQTLMMQLIMDGKILADKYAGTKKRWKQRGNQEADRLTYVRFCANYKKLMEGT